MNRDLSLVTFTISSNTCIVQFDCAPLSYGRRTLSVHLFILPQYPPVPVFRKTIVPYIITVFIPPSTLPRTHAPALTSTATESDGSLNTKETAFDLVEFGASVPVGAMISVGLVDAKRGTPNTHYFVLSRCAMDGKRYALTKVLPHVAFNTLSTVL